MQLKKQKKKMKMNLVMFKTKMLKKIENKLRSMNLKIIKIAQLIYITNCLQILKIANHLPTSLKLRSPTARRTFFRNLRPI